MRPFKLITFLIMLIPLCSFSALKASIFNIKPWGYLDSKGKAAGIDAEIVHAISKEMGVPIKIDLVPYKRMMHQLQHGQTDFAIFFKSEKSKLVAKPLIKWGELDIIIVGRKNIKIKQYSDLSNKRIAVRLGGYFHPKFDNDQSLRKQSFENYEDGIIALKKNKIDLIIGTAATLFYEFEKNGIRIEELNAPYFIGVKEDWLHFSRKSDHLKKQADIKKAVNKLLSKGVFSQIFSKYLPKKWEHK